MKKPAAPQSCRNCRFLDVEPNKIGVRRPIQSHGYPCRWEAPKSYKLPDSVTSAYGYRQIRPQRFMSPEDGTSCPTWEKIS